MRTLLFAAALALLGASAAVAQTFPSRPVTIIAPFPPAALGAFYKAETEKWWPVINAAGLKVE